MKTMHSTLVLYISFVNGALTIMAALCVNTCVTNWTTHLNKLVSRVLLLALYCSMIFSLLIDNTSCFELVKLFFLNVYIYVCLGRNMASAPKLEHSLLTIELK